MNTETKSRRHLIRSLAAGETDLHALAREHGMTLIEMAKWIRLPRHVKALALLEELLERRTSLLIADARSNAAAALRRMATADTPKETARRACLDLLKLHGVRDASNRGTAPEDEGDAHSNAAAAELNRLMNDMNAPAVDESVAGAAEDDAGVSEST